MAQFGASLYRNFRVYQIFGANTNVGKTIFSTLLCRIARRLNQAENVWYLKPVSTGPFDDADKWHLDRFARNVNTQDFYQFDQPVSPHLAASTHNVTDEALLAKLTKQIKLNAQAGPGFMLVETAGGPHSPGPAGTSQADLFRPLRLPLLFVADWRLGGISTSISSYEALRMRGYDVEGVAVFRDSRYQNFDYFTNYFRERDVPLLTAPLPPAPNEAHDHSSMANYYISTETASEEDPTGMSTTGFFDTLADRHGKRVDRLESIADQAQKHIWYPFTQHQGLDKRSLNVVDSAYGDFFQTYRPASRGEGDGQAGSNIIGATFDGSASWWTQGLGHSNTALTSAAAYAAGRYGHVMFAEGVHEPAMSLAENLLGRLRNPRLQRVFYSDNGSSGMEVALKMGLRASCTRYNWDDSGQGIDILGLQCSYHGDTIGAMDMSEPSVFNRKVAWYSGHGHWFDFPRVMMQKGVWTVAKPNSVQGQLGDDAVFTSLSNIFDPARDLTDDAATYEKYIQSTLERLTLHEKRRFGALVMEPVVLGAGGMVLVDPLFQRTLVNVVRKSSHLFSPETPAPRNPQDTWTGLPVIADEVFAGLYRLGTAAPSPSLLHVHPDISVHAKLLTGGLLPLAATCASESVFESCLSDEKADALLHGHSYTAHAIGCAVANESLRQFQNIEEAGKWDGFKADWAGSGRPVVSELATAIKEAAKNAMPGISQGFTTAEGAEPPVPIWSVWSTAFVAALSHRTDRINGVWALGSILSMELKEADGKGGYTSKAAKDVQKKLREVSEGNDGWNVHSRTLGNVIYLMASQISEESEIRALEGRVKEVLAA